MSGKNVEQTIADAQAPHTWMPRTLGTLSLTMMGIGVTVGSGLFVLTGTAAANYAGPAITISFVIGAAVALLVGAIVFGAYTGFDIIASSAEETRQPQRAVPLAIAGTLLVCSTLYVSVSFVLTGMVRYDRIDPAAPVTGALRMVGATWTALGVATGAVVGLAAVVLVMMMGQARVFLAMSRDGLLPNWFAAVHPKRRTPQRITIILGAGVSVVAGTTPITELAELSNIGTLAAFALVSGGVLRLRATRPDLVRAFRVPLVPWLPILAILACVVLALHYPLVTWARFVIWMMLGLLLYFSVARRRSARSREPRPAGPGR